MHSLVRRMVWNWTSTNYSLSSVSNRLQAQVFIHVASAERVWGQDFNCFVPTKWLPFIGKWLQFITSPTYVGLALRLQHCPGTNSSHTKRIQALFRQQRYDVRSNLWIIIADNDNYNLRIRYSSLIFTFSLSNFPAKWKRESAFKMLFMSSSAESWRGNGSLVLPLAMSAPARISDGTWQLNYAHAHHEVVSTNLPGYSC